MLEFFIGLFGGLFYGTKLHKDKTRSKKANEANQQMIAEMKADLDRWLSKVVDKKFESELDEIIAYPSNRQAIFDLISHLITRIIPEIKSVDDFQGSVCNNPEIIKLILMSQRGKIPQQIAQYGLRSPAVFNDDEKKKWKQIYSVMSSVDRELSKYNIEAMIFSDGSEVGLARFTGNARAIGDVRTPVGGVYYWWSCRNNIR